MLNLLNWLRLLRICSTTPHLIEAFESLEDIIPDEVVPLLDYFERTHVGRRLHVRRHDPLYSHDFWNVHGRVINGDPKQGRRPSQPHKSDFVNPASHNLEVHRSIETIAKHKQK